MRSAAACRRFPLLRSSSAVLVASLALLATPIASPAPARAQSPELAPVREALATYDLDGDRTLGALRDLERAIATVRTEDARREARFLRAAVATDLWIAAALGTDAERAPREARIASALSVREDGVAEHLRGELGAVGSGVYRAPARAAIAALALRDAVIGGDIASIEWSRHAGPRRDLLLVRASASGISASIAPDPCGSGGGACAEPFAQLDAGSRRELASRIEISAAMARLERAARGGDPLAAVLIDRVRPIATRVEGETVHPASRVPETLPIDAAEGGGEPVRPALLIAVASDAIHLARPASYGVRAGRAVAREEGDDVLPRARRVALPREYRPVITAVDELVEAIRAVSLAEGAVVALAAAPDVPAHVVARVIASAARAGRAPALLVRRAPDGTLRGASIALLAADDEPGVLGDLVVRVRMGGYGLARGRGREQSIPRVRAAAGLAFDLDGLGRAAERIPHRRTILDAMPSLPAHDLFDAAFRLSPVFLAN